MSFFLVKYVVQVFKYLCTFIAYAILQNFQRKFKLVQGQARGIWTYHLKKAQYHEGPLFLRPRPVSTLRIQRYQKKDVCSLSFK